MSKGKKQTQVHDGDKLNKKHPEKEYLVCGDERVQNKYGFCLQVAGWGTDHLYNGRCKLHGGKSTGAPKGNKNAIRNKGGAAPPGNKNAMTHGAYETIIREKLDVDDREIFDAISDNDDLKQELKILRYKLLRLLDPIEKELVVGTPFGAERLTIEVDEVTKAYAIEKLVDGIRKVVKDIQGGGGDDGSLEALANIIQASRQRYSKEVDS